MLVLGTRKVLVITPTKLLANQFKNSCKEWQIRRNIKLDYVDGFDTVPLTDRDINDIRGQLPEVNEIIGGRTPAEQKIGNFIEEPKGKVTIINVHQLAALVKITGGDTGKWFYDLTA